MQVFTYHLARADVRSTLLALYRPPTRDRVPGLIHAECMAGMELGAPVVSPSRVQLNNLTMFAAWESAGAIDGFLANTKLGQCLTAGWHVRMAFLRRWGTVKEFDSLPECDAPSDQEAPVVAVTLARMKLPQIPRFIRWGRPVEELVRDHPKATLALASMRLPRTVSTFSIWTTQRDMADMVHGHSQASRPERHADAMKERNRKDFHFEFTTLRFKPLEESGIWKGRSNFVPV
ncbi:MAG: hypothetical protein KF833_13395 [Verrucomicrobiae bacterium]|nr:hypothetical protein [Verrucomicrobiae bacterium]